MSLDIDKYNGYDTIRKVGKMYLSYKTSSIMLVVASIVTYLAKVSYPIPVILFILAYGFLMTQLIVDSMDQKEQRMYDYIIDTKKTKIVK
jgi:Na+-transporting methylmalonyl-CoA/oxaloacetate decarboxylase beta subunit